MNDIERAIDILSQDICYIGHRFTRDEYDQAVQIVIAASEKQIPKKPEFYGDNEDGKLLCPSCSEDLWDIRECGYNGCPYCLQAIDWSGEDE